MKPILILLIGFMVCGCSSTSVEIESRLNSLENAISRNARDVESLGEAIGYKQKYIKTQSSEVIEELKWVKEK